VNTMKLGRGVEGVAFAVSIHHAIRLLGTGFAPKSDRDARREDGIQAYRESVRLLAQRADQVEANWKKFRSSCDLGDSAPFREREWLALAEDHQPPTRDSASCRSWLDYFRDAAAKTRSALIRYDATARAAGLSDREMRVIRRRHNMDWTAWEP